MAQKRYRQRGFTLLASAVSAVAMFGMAGLVIDLGRMYITKNEAQSFADSASLYAALQLNGAASGLTNADAAVAANPNKWNFGTTAFSGTIIEYSADGSTGWATSGNVANPATIQYVRVTAVVNNVALLLLPVTGTGTTATVKAQAVGSQVVVGTSSTNTIKNSIFPYSPIAPAAGSSYSAVMASDPTGNFGFTVGQQYDLKWPNSPQTGTAGANKVPCAGDDNTAMINRQNGAGSQWGEIVLNPAESIAQEITDDAGNVSVYLGMVVNPTTGTKNTITTALTTRVSQDGDTTSNTYADYIANTAHNGRRLINVIVNSGYSDAAGNLLPTNQQAIAVGFAQFLLLTDYNNSGGANNAWCAIYVGPSPVMDSANVGGGSIGGGGVGVIRLVQ